MIQCPAFLKGLSVEPRFIFLNIWSIDNCIPHEIKDLLYNPSFSSFFTHFFLERIPEEVTTSLSFLARKVSEAFLSYLSSKGEFEDWEKNKKNFQAVHVSFCY
jgi:hypothetical protein